MAALFNKRGLVLGLALATVLALVGLLAFGLVQANKRGASEEQETRFTTASEIVLPSLTDDSIFTLSAFKGRQAVVLNFWFPSCPPCRAEMPGLEQLWQENQSKGMVLVGVFVPNVVDGEREANRFVRELGLTYPMVTDTRGEATLEYGVSGFPTTVFITRDGKVQRKWIGYLDLERMRAFTRELLGS